MTKRLLLALSLWIFASLLGCEQRTAQPRFDSAYFFQSESDLQKKKVDFEQVSIYSRLVQSKVSQVLKKAKIPESNGYMVLAVRADGEVAIWFDMTPSLHEYYDYELVEAVKKIAPFHVESGVAVFAVKMSIETAKHTEKAVPEPQEWIEAKKKIADPNNIEQLVLSIWPE